MNRNTDAFVLIIWALLWAVNASSSSNIRGRQDELKADKNNKENNRSLLLASLLSTSSTTTSQCNDVVFFHVEASITPGDLFATGCHAADFKGIGDLLNQKLYDVGIANADAVLDPSTTLVASVCVDPTITGATTMTASVPASTTPATSYSPDSTAMVAATTATTTTTTTASTTTTTVAKTLAPTPSPTSRSPTSAPTSAPKKCFLFFCTGGRRNRLLLGVSVQAFVYVGGGACRFCAKDNADARRLGLLGGIFALTTSIINAILGAFTTKVGDPVAQKLETDLETELYWKFPCVGTMPMVNIQIDPVSTPQDVGPSLDCVDLPYKTILGIP